MTDYETHRKRFASELELCSELIAYHESRAKSPASLDALIELRLHRERLLDSPFRFHKVDAR